MKMVTYYESSIASGDVELRLLIEIRECAYSLWRSGPSCRSGVGNWRESRHISDQVVTREKFFEKQCRSFGAI
jgi:hypothetical protein